MILGGDYMLYSNEEYIKKLLDENKLHDSEVVGLKLNEKYFQIDVSCKGMNPAYYFEKIDNVIMSIKIYNVSQLEFDYLGSSIFVNDFDLNQDKGVKITINGDDLIVCGDRFEITCEEVRKYDESNRKLSDFLKNS